MNDARSQSRSSLLIEDIEQLDRICTAFEEAWRTGTPVHMEEYLRQGGETIRRVLLEELVALEVDLRRTAGDDVSIHEYLNRFPTDQDAVQRGFAVTQERLSQRNAASTGDSAERNDTDVQCRTTDIDVEMPTHIDRYRIERLLGAGQFGVVYLAHDPVIDRWVAIKMPRPERVGSDKDLACYVEEARNAAKLDHPGIVRIFDVQHKGDSLFVIQQYIQGQNLATLLAHNRPDPRRAAGMIIAIAQALQHAHQQGVVHRDLKPANILIDEQDQPHVADFGLAVHETTQRRRRGESAGSPAYMSPEQVRGETHWIDGRTDIWALGVMLYEMLAGHRPFTAPDVEELFAEIQERDPQPPRMKDPAIPKELERICLKCLAKRRTQRYTAASDLLEDLGAFLAMCPDSEAPVVTDRMPLMDVETCPGAADGAGGTFGPDADGIRRSSTPTHDSDSRPPLRVVPKGLRSFDKDDRDFFLELLPGPRDRAGLPDAIRFWKTRIEEMDADATFAVGVMYGPSGCGKSSLVKAGLLPHLAPRVLPIFVEATPSDTELRLLKTLRKHIPCLTAEASLADALALLREGRATEARKVLLVLDQFEQWLHTTADMDSSQLVRALRQCDGANVQCLILVRDDFWMSTTRFMQALEIPQVENQNSAAVDLFDPSHARKVLRAFGLAYGRLPEHDMSADEQRFLDRAVQDLAHDGKVICVQLSLLADMMKGRPWTPASLQEVGGTSGVGVAFLDETFTVRTAPPTHRLHAKAAQAVLKALLPEVGTDIRGQMQPAERLLECSGYAARPDDCRDLLQILNRELRLITPTEPEENESRVTEPAPVAADRQFYQLTHDYLVPSLRDWLTRKQKETRRGRVELKLVERSALWNARPENRHLPSLWEYGNIRMLTRRNHWNEPQRKMMRRAGRLHAMRWGTGLLVALLVGLGIQQAIFHVRGKNLRERLQTAVATVGNSRGPVVPNAIADLGEFPPEEVRDALKTAFADPDVANNQRLALAYALAEYGHVDRTLLVKAIATAPSEEVDNLATALVHDRDSAVAELKKAAATATSPGNWELKTRLAALALYLQDTTIAAEMLQTVSPAAPAWRNVDEQKRGIFTAAHGMITDRFAFCLDMPWDTFKSTVGSLRDIGYRPTRVRPFVANSQRLVAAVWTRDSLKWDLQYDQTVDQLPSPYAAAVKDGLVPEDVAGYTTADNTTLFALLWCQPAAGQEQRHVLVDNAGYALGEPLLRLQAYLSTDGMRRYAGIADWDDSSSVTTMYAVTDKLDRSAGEIQSDISLAPIGQLPDPLDYYRDVLKKLPVQPDVSMKNRTRHRRAYALYGLGQPTEALVELDGLREEGAFAKSSLDDLRSLCLAQMGRADEARQAAQGFLAYAQSTSFPRDTLHVRIMVSAWLGELDEAQQQLDAFLATDANNEAVIYRAACKAAEMARAVAVGRRDAEEAARLRQRSLELLRTAIGAGWRDIAHLESDPDLAVLHGEPDFTALVAELTATRYYAGVWQRDLPFGPDGHILSDLSLEQHQERAAELEAEGFRPLSLAVNVLHDASEPQVAATWYRPLPPSLTWNPTQRTMFIEHFPKWSGSVEKLIDVLVKTDHASLRSGIVLALSGIEEPTAEAIKEWTPVLGGWHENDADSGVHSATDFALRSWGAAVPTVEPPRESHGEFDWWVTKSGLTMIRIPAGYVERPLDRQRDDPRKLIRTESAFWLSDREVSRGQFRTFLNDKEADRPDDVDDAGLMSDDRDEPFLPADVGWYDAVMFCNWLSRQEGRGPRYVKDGKEQVHNFNNTIREYDAWKLIPGTNGYRLPTEDEWEYACRARTPTAFCFGDIEDLLDRYAVFVKNAVYTGYGARGPSPVGARLCNAWGLFDMHGNVGEWCQDADSDGWRVRRGGSPDSHASECHAAARSTSPPNVQAGFRVALDVMETVDPPNDGE